MRGWTEQLAISACLLCAFVIGCSREEGITRYQAPRTSTADTVFEEMKQVRDASSSKEPDRMLAAVVRRGQKAWFFKLTGTDQEVLSQQPHFTSFIQSLRFVGESEQPEWDLPTGWKRMPAMGMRFATLQVGSDKHPVELTVIPLAISQQDYNAYLLDNLNRWCEQLALPPFTSLDAVRAGDKEAKEDEETKEGSSALTELALADGTPATVVNLLGRTTLPKGTAALASGQLPPSHPPIDGNRFGGLPPSHPPIDGKSLGGLPASHPPLDGTALGKLGGQSTVGGGTGPGQLPISFTQPAEWKASQSGGIRVASFDVVDEDRKAEITVISLSASGGDRLANVNRWREQVQLPPVSEDELNKALEAIEIDGRKGQFVELLGPERPGGRETILGVLADDAGKTWFVKLKGNADLAQREKPRFKSFVTSIKFQPAENR